MEHAVAEAGQQRDRQQQPVGGHEPGERDRGREQCHAAQEDPERAHPVHQEPGQGLADSGRAVEDAHRQPERHVGHTEHGLQQRKERRQDQLEEVAEEVRHPDETDHSQVAAETGSSGRIGHGLSVYTTPPGAAPGGAIRPRRILL